MTHQYPDILDEKTLKEYADKVYPCNLFTPWIQTYLGEKYIHMKPSSEYALRWVKYDEKAQYDMSEKMYIRHYKCLYDRQFYMYKFTESNNLDELDKLFIKDYKSFETIKVKGLHASCVNSLYFTPTLEEAIGLVHKEIKDISDIKRIYVTTVCDFGKDSWDNYRQRHRATTIAYVVRNDKK